MPTAAYISRRVVLPTHVAPAAIVVDTASGTILRITDPSAPGPVDHIHNVGDHAILPGLIDPHVHINEPGRTHWEGFATATRAAAAGGITTVVDMPLNCLPPTTTVAGLQAKRSAATNQCTVDWRAWGGAENGNQQHLQALAAAGVPGFKAFLVYPGCDGLGLLDEANLRAAIPTLARLQLPLLVHAELPGPIDTAAASLTTADLRQYANYLASRPDEAELAAIRLLLDLCGHQVPLHIVHLATALGLPLLAAAKSAGQPVTVETCPHYLYFAAEEIPDGSTLQKCAPPIRSRANRDQLRAALINGQIDLVASDHSPCPPEMKSLDTGDFSKAWGGIASLSLGVSILNTVLSKPQGAPCLDSETWDEPARLLTIARLMSANPAILAGVSHRKGRIAPGFDADLAIFAPEEPFTVTPADLHFRHPVSPYLGERLTGRIHQTILRGTCIFHHGTFPSAPIGREVTA